MQVGPGDIFILMYFITVLLSGKRILIRNEFLILALVFATIILLSMIANVSIFGLNTLVTVPLKIVLVGIFCTDLLKSKLNRLDTIVIDLNIAINCFLLVFLSDALEITSFELFNRNELVAYTSALFCLRVVAMTQERNIGTDSSVPIWFPLLILGLMAIIAQSRQSLFALIVAGLVIYMLFSSSKTSFFLKIIVSGLCITLFVSVVSNMQFEGYQGARLKTLQNFEPATRADKQRLENISQGINGAIEKPIFGHGPTSFRRNNEFDKVAHNSYITAVYELGFVGLIVILTTFMRLARPLMIKTQNLRLRRSSIAIGGLAIFFFVQSLFIEFLGKAPFYIFLLCSIYIVQKVKNI
jgi:O-antigen ligase